ncbi:MAG: efflux transporter outer membrane subunit, partial [Tannerella sp.]|nr:efflux transporter outer membrane subunit [Tannerella sp.]
MNYNFLHTFLIIAAVAVVTSCGIVTPYNRSEQLPVDDMFRTFDEVDTTFSFAAVSVSDFYNDALLQQLIVQALDSNMNMRIAVNRLAQMSAYLKQRKASLYPTLNLGLSASLSDVSKYGNSPKPADPYTELRLAATAGWEVDIWGRLSSLKRSQEALYFQQEATVRATQTQLVAAIASAYYQLIMLDHQQEVTEASISSYTNYLNTVRALKESAQVTEVAVLQAKAQLASAQALLPQIKASIAAEENYICLLLGKTPEAIPRTDNIDMTIFHSAILSVGVPAQLLANRPDVVAAEYALRAAHEEFNAARAALYPQLTLTGSVGPDAKGLDNWFSMPGSLLWNAVAGLTQPIFNGRALKTQKEIAQLQEDVAFLTFKQTLLDAGSEVTDALASILYISQQAAYQYEQVEALKKAYEYSQELLVNGYATYLDVLSAQNNVLSSELALYST